MYKFLPLIAAALILASCSNSEPEASDIKKNIEQVFAKCPQISVQDTEKTNGIKESESTYTVNAKFTLKNTPSPENEELFKIYTEISTQQKKLEQEFLGMQDELSKAKDNLRGFSPEMKESTEYKEKENIFNAKANESDDFREKLNDNRIKVGESKGNLERNFNNKCLVNGSFGNKLLFDLFNPIQGFSVKDENEYVGKEFSREFSAKIKMIKTDNGWMIEELAR